MPEGNTHNITAMTVNTLCIIWYIILIYIGTIVSLLENVTYTTHDRMVVKFGCCDCDIKQYCCCWWMMSQCFFSMFLFLFVARKEAPNNRNKLCFRLFFILFCVFLFSCFDRDIQQYCWWKNKSNEGTTLIWYHTSPIMPNTVISDCEVRAPIQLGIRRMLKTIEFAVALWVSLKRDVQPKLPENASTERNSHV